MATLIPYIRVSTDEQGNSLRDQQRLIEGYAELFGHTLLQAVVDEDVSAGTPLEKRRGGAELMARLEAGEADGFVCTELDRVFRLAVDGLVKAEWFEERGLAFHTISDRIDTSAPDGWLSFAIRLVTAEWERRKIGHRTRRTMDGLRQECRVYGPAPYGTFDAGGFLLRDPETWAVRERIVAMKGEGTSLRAICKQLQAEKVPAPGGKGKGGKATGGRLWHANTVKNIIKTHHDLEHIPEMPGELEAQDSTKGGV